MLAEEQGFLGVLFTLGLYLFVILRSLDTARVAKDRTGMYLVMRDHGRIFVSSDLQRHDVGWIGSCERVDTPARELRWFFNYFDTDGIWVHSQRENAPVYQLTGFVSWL